MLKIQSAIWLYSLGYRSNMTFEVIWISKTLIYLILMRYWANATASGFPVMVMVRSVAPPSLSSQLLIRIIAPLICLNCGKEKVCHYESKWAEKHDGGTVYEIKRKSSYLISAIFVPPFPMMQPISSLGTVISWVCVPVCGGPPLPACAGGLAPPCCRVGWFVRNWLPARAAKAAKT